MSPERERKKRRSALGKAAHIADRRFSDSFLSRLFFLWGLLFEPRRHPVHSLHHLVARFFGLVFDQAPGVLALLRGQ